MDGLLLFSHGSLLCGAGQALDQHAARLREWGAFPVVEVGYLNYSEPTFETGVRRLAEAGADRITIAPYFLVPGYFVTNSLPKKLSGIKERFPGVEFIVAEALGDDDLLVEALIESAEDAAAIQPGNRSHYIVSASQCRNRPDCPIYRSIYCPMSANDDLSADVSALSAAISVIPSEVEGTPT